MVTNINVGGVERPILFGFGALYCYELATGRNAIEDFTNIESGQGVSVTIMVQLIKSGFVCGAQSQNVKVDFDDLDVAAWMSDDPGLFQKCMTMLSASFPRESADDAKKKNQSQPKARKG